MNTDKWVKIGEVIRRDSYFRSGLYANYAVMECIKSNGMRKYKTVLIASWTESVTINCQPQNSES